MSELSTISSGIASFLKRKKDSKNTNCDAATDQPKKLKKDRKSENRDISQPKEIKKKKRYIEVRFLGLYLKFWFSFQLFTYIEVY